MENRDFEELLKESLKPEMQAEAALDQAILEKIGTEAKTTSKGKVRKFPARHFIPKVAAIVLAVMVAGIGTTYAAGKIIEQIRVTEHGISVGNGNYVSDEDLAAPWESVPVENLGEEQGGPEDKWTKKRVELVSGLYENTYYSYPDYLTAISDVRFNSMFASIPGKEQAVTYCVSNLGNDTWEYSLDAIFEYQGGRVSTYQSVTEGNVAKDAAFSIVMQKTGNVRTYVNSQGAEYTLVDDLGYAEQNGGESCTMVLFSCREFQGYVAFYGLSEELICGVLDTLTVRFEDIYEGVEEICEGAEVEESAGEDSNASVEESAEDEGNAAVEESTGDDATGEEGTGEEGNATEVIGDETEVVPESETGEMTEIEAEEVSESEAGEQVEDEAEEVNGIESGELAETEGEEANGSESGELTKAEAEAILRESEEKFEEIRIWLSERDFSGEKEFADDELVTLYHLDPERRIGYAEYFLSRKDKVGNEKYYRIFADYELISKDEGPKLKNVVAKEVDREAFLAAKNQTEKVVFIKGQQ